MRWRFVRVLQKWQHLPTGRYNRGFFYERGGVERRRHSAVGAHSTAPAANPLHSDVTCVHRVAADSIRRALRLKKGDGYSVAAARNYDSSNRKYDS